MTVAGSRPLLAWLAHRPTTTGVKAKIMNGLKDWNHVVGISTVQSNRLMVRSVSLVGPQRDGVTLLLVGGPEQQSARIG